jgi:hypothetical protein
MAPNQDAQPDDTQPNATGQPNTPSANALPPNDQATDAEQRGGMPGDGAGRRDETGISGIYPLSASEGADPNAPIVAEPAFGQGDRGAAGYNDSGDSETIIVPPDEKENPTQQAED